MDSFEQLWVTVKNYLGELATAAERDTARRKLLNRLHHVELGGNPQAAPPPPPPSTGNTWANRQPNLCVRCNAPRAYHDIDGLHDGCDGYVEMSRG